MEGIVMREGESAVGLPGRLRSICERVRSLLASATASDVHTRYRAGRLLLKVKGAPGTYGAGAVASLARELGRDAATLYRYALVPERWSPHEMKVLVARRTPVGEPLSWSHWVELAQVESTPLRNSLTELALCEGLPVRELVRRIEHAGESASPEGARLPSVRETLVSLTALADRLSAQVSGGLDDVLSSDRVTFLRTTELEVLFNRAIEAHTGLHERVQARLGDLVAARTQIVKSRAASLQSTGSRTRGTQPRLLSGGRTP
jgi:hypothetical protein